MDVFMYDKSACMCVSVCGCLQQYNRNKIMNTFIFLDIQDIAMYMFHKVVHTNNTNIYFRG